MKKRLIYSLTVLAGMTFAGCSGDYDDWADPQSASEGAAASKYGIAFAAGPDANVVMPVSDDDIKLVSLSAEDAKVTGFAVNKVLVNGEEISATVDDGNVVVSAAELNAIVTKQNFSRASVTRDIDVKTEVSIVLSTGDAVTTDVVGETKATITPAAVPAVDTNGYYILADWQGWNTEDPQWMTDNGDGTFTATATTTSDGDNWFKFYQGSHYAANDWDVINEGQMGCAVNGDGALDNLIVWNGDTEYPDGVQTPVIKGQGTFEITIDVNNYTYSVKRAEAKYYVVGTIQGWSNTDMSCMFYAEGGNVYSYTTQWAGEWDLKIWDSRTFGNWEVAWGTAVDGDDSASGSLINAGSQSFEAPSKGYYTLTINMNDMSYQWTAVTPSVEYSSVSLIGDFNGWGDDIDMDQLAGAPHNWYVRAVIPSDGGLKFRADHDWVTSWGTDDATAIGDVYYLAPGAGNITVPAGTYDFYLNDITGRWNIVRVD